ncbi:MAG: patatin-like phospholipase family protein [Phenylobacterium sp.]
MADDPTPRFQFRRGRRPAPIGVDARMPGFERARLTIGEAEDSLAEAADRLSLPRLAGSREDFNILAISGGASGGAFGAGVLVGLTRAAKRPKFAIVTGVSTGALMAPFAFLGPDWDDRLADAYVGGHAARIWSLSRLAPTLDGGLLRPEALDSLIDPFVDAEMIAAVAREHALGRRLLVATTNLDSEEACLWDMGEIASQGGDEALKLFRTVLAASASLPGLFPPRRIRCEADGVAYDELHADGGLAAPLFVMPEALLRWRDLGRRLRRGRIYVIVNMSLAQTPRTTETNVASVLLRSFDTMLRFSYRQALSIAANFCADRDLPLSVASLPIDPLGRNMLTFDTAVMKGIFEAAIEQAQGPNLWVTPLRSAPPKSWSRLIQAFGATP